jgi:hypothetical protein
MVFEEHLDAFFTGLPKALDSLVMSPVEGAVDNDRDHSTRK